MKWGARPTRTISHYIQSFGHPKSKCVFLLITEFKDLVGQSVRASTRRSKSESAENYFFLHIFEACSYQNHLCCAAKKILNTPFTLELFTRFFCGRSIKLSKKFFGLSKEIIKFNTHKTQMNNEFWKDRIKVWLRIRIHFIMKHSFLTNAILKLWTSLLKFDNLTF
jgi:hypothetical protein